MAGRRSEVFKILFYLVLFFFSFLVFESVSVIVAVGVALFALYYFTSTKAPPSRISSSDLISGPLNLFAVCSGRYPIEECPNRHVPSVGSVAEILRARKDGGRDIAAF